MASSSDSKVRDGAAGDEAQLLDGVLPHELERQPATLLVPLDLVGRAGEIVERAAVAPEVRELEAAAATDPPAHAEVVARVRRDEGGVHHDGVADDPRHERGDEHAGDDGRVATSAPPPEAGEQPGDERPRARIGTDTGRTSVAAPSASPMATSRARLEPVGLPRPVHEQEHGDENEQDEQRLRQRDGACGRRGSATAPPRRRRRAARTVGRRGHEATRDRGTRATIDSACHSDVQRGDDAGLPDDRRHEEPGGQGERVPDGVVRGRRSVGEAVAVARRELLAESR